MRATYNNHLPIGIYGTFWFMITRALIGFSIFVHVFLVWASYLHATEHESWPAWVWVESDLDGGEYEGNYTLTENVPTGLPFDENFYYLQQIDGPLGDGASPLGRILYSDNRWHLYDATYVSVDQQVTITEEPMGTYVNGSVVTHTVSPPPSAAPGADSNQTYDSDDDVPTLENILAALGDLDSDDDNASLTLIFNELVTLNSKFGDTTAGTEPEVSSSDFVVSTGAQTTAAGADASNIIGEQIDITTGFGGSMPSTSFTLGDESYAIDLEAPEFSEAFTVAKAGLTSIVIISMFYMTWSLTARLVSS